MPDPRGAAGGNRSRCAITNARPFWQLALRGAKGLQSPPPWGGANNLHFQLHVSAEFGKTGDHSPMKIPSSCVLSFLRRSATRLIAVFLAIPALVPANAEVVISEIHAAPNSMRLEWNANGEPRIGVGPYWQDVVFPETGWTQGTAPIGVGATNTTNLSALLLNKTPSFYVRKQFTVDANQLTFGDLILRITYDDGFVAYINGKEVTRANLGPAKQITYATMVATRVDAPAAPVEYNLGPLVNWLQAGSNVLAVQVHNQIISGNSKFDAQLVSVINPVVGTPTDINFNDGNDASVTRTYTGASLSTTSTGTPLAGSWVSAPAPLADTAWTSLTMKSTASSTAGVTGSGGMRYDISQTGPDSTLGIVGGPVSFTPFVDPATITTADLAKLTFSFRYRVTAGTTYGLRFDATAGGAALTGFPDLTLSGNGLETAALSFATNSGGQRKRFVSNTGVISDFTSGSVVTPTAIYTGPAMRGAGALTEIVRITEDATAGAGDGASTGAVKIAMINQPTVPDYFGVTLSGFAVQSWPAGTLTTDNLAELSVKFAWRADAGQTFSAYIEPTNGAYADRLDLGSFTGTGAWQTSLQRLNAGTNSTAFLSKVNAANIRTFRIGIRRDTSLPSGSFIWLDNVGFVSDWQVYTTTLAAGTVGAQANFVSAISGSGATTFHPVFEKRSTAPALPDSHFLTLDDVKLRFNGQPLATPATFIAYAQAWSYWPGLAEPSGGLVETALFPSTLEDVPFSDWLELHNDSNDTVNLTGWSLTDDSNLPQKFVLPSGTQLAPQARMVILADAPTLPIAGATYLHANFKLGATGGYLSLRDDTGAVRSEILDYGKQLPNYSWGLDPANPGNYVYLNVATPGTANSGSTSADYVRTPDFSLPGGFYATAQTVSFTCETPDAEIRYTIDGSDPSPTSLLYSTPLVLNQVAAGNGHCLRIRAFKAGWAASAIKTRNYLIAQSPNLTTGPALILTGDPQRSLFDPFGIFSIVGGNYGNGGAWQSDGPTAYNNAAADGAISTSTGKGWERPVEVELYFPNGQDGFRQTAGIRVSGSPHARPRYTLDTITSAPWNLTNFAEKPSLNLFFREEWDQNKLDYPILGDTYERKKFESIRLRAGKNDVRDPFVRDEYCRRLFGLMGQKTSWGTIFPVYVNGKFRGYYNAVERLREEFMQQHYNSSENWDVRYITDMVDGDAVAFNDLIARLNAYGSDLANPAKLQAVLDVLDTTNYADYALLNAWTGTGDWPHNNYCWGRERTANGKWRLFVWDAEGAFGGFSKGLGYNIFTQDLLANPTTAGREICLVYTRLKNSPEFRLLMADRINKHFCNDGALADASLTSAKDQLINMLQPIFTYTGGGALNQSFFTSWVNTTNDKRDVLFRSAILSSGATATAVASYATGGASSTIVNIGTHTLTAGRQIVISGSTVTAYNGTFTISAVTGTTVTIPVAFTTDPGANNRGTWLPGVVSYASGGTGSTIVNIGTHTLTPGLSITIAGSTVTAYNGTFVISNTTASTVTIPVTFTSDPGVGNRGTYLRATTDFGYQLSKEDIWPARPSVVPAPGVPTQQGTWLAPQPPMFAQHGGNVPQGYQLSIQHTEIDDDRTKSTPYKSAVNQAPAGRIIYYTKDGSDPRLTGGMLNPTALTYSAPFTLTNAFTTIKTRIKDTTNNEWSPLTEAIFTVAASQAAASNLVVAELMYNPAAPTAAEITAGFIDKDDFEFIRLQNISAAPVDLRALQFIDGVDYNFATTTVPAVDPGASVLLVKNAAAFRQRYGTGYDSRIAGEYLKNFDNNGELITVRSNNLPTSVLRQFTYNDKSPWPAAADGTGASLVLINPASNPDHTVASNWTASALPGGLFTEQEAPNYDRWKSFSFTTTEAADALISGPTADPDTDGFSNLTEFALAMNPKKGQADAPTADLRNINGQNYLCIEYRKADNAQNVSVHAQVGSTLEDWSTPGTGVVAVSSTPHPDGSTSYVYRDAQPLESTNRRFIRLMITLAP